MGREKRRSYWHTVRSIILFAALGFVLYSVFLPGPPRPLWIARGKATQAVSEINGIELGVTKMLSDAGSRNLRDFFDDSAFSDAVARLGRERAMAPFEASVEIYSHCTYALLRKGRHALDPVIFNDYPSVLKPALVKRLANSYYPELAFDPWGELYRIFPGPWPEDMGPVIFRIFLPTPPSRLSPGETASATDSLLMSGLDIDTGEPLTFGVPAPSNQDAYIWSFGANLVSGQPVYDPSHAYAPPAQQHYDASQELELCGGGDDINNWDRNQTFMRFYN